MSAGGAPVFRSSKKTLSDGWMRTGGAPIFRYTIEYSVRSGWGLERHPCLGTAKKALSGEWMNTVGAPIFRYTKEYSVRNGWELEGHPYLGTIKSTQWGVDERWGTPICRYTKVLSEEWMSTGGHPYIGTPKSTRWGVNEGWRGTHIRYSKEHSAGRCKIKRNSCSVQSYETNLIYTQITCIF